MSQNVVSISPVRTVFHVLERQQTNRQADGRDQTYYLPCFAVDNKWGPISAAN